MSEAAVASITSFGLLDHWIAKDGVFNFSHARDPIQARCARETAKAHQAIDCWRSCMLSLITYSVEALMMIHKYCVTTLCTLKDLLLLQE